MLDVARSFEFKSIAIAQRSAGKAIVRMRKIGCVQNEHEGEHPFDRPGIDIALIRHVAAAPDPAPIANEEMAVPVFHRPLPQFETEISLVHLTEQNTCHGLTPG